MTGGFADLALPVRQVSQLFAAAKGGDSDAQVAIAETLAAANDGAAALGWLRRAVDSGNHFAKALLGAWEILGYQVDVDISTGRQRIEAAAAAGVSPACALLAYLYATGLAVTQDWERALDWLVTAASLGNARALTQVGLLVSDDASPGLKITLWWSAATCGFSPAQLLLGKVLAASREPRSREVGAAWIGTAALAGNPLAMALAGSNPSTVKHGAVISLEGIDFTQVRGLLRLGMWVEEPDKKTLLDSPRIVTASKLLPEDVCDYLVSLAAPSMQPAKVNAVEGGGPVRHRMRTNSWMQFELTNSDPVLALVNHRLAGLTCEPASLQENTAVLWYRPGQTYADHYDFIDPQVPHFQAELASRGQRIATALVYLNEGYVGGETDFPLLGLRYRGQQGDAITFPNVEDNGRPDRRMLHAGRPPKDSDKWLLSKWVRDRDQLGRLW